MSYDPYQTYPQIGPYSGITALNNPYAAGLQTAPNAALAPNPFAGAALGLSNIPNAGMPQGGQQLIPGLPNQGGINLQQLQLAALLASQGALSQLLGFSPLATGLHNPMLANQGLGPQYGYQPHSMYGQVGQGGWPFGQISPYGQQAGAPFPNSQGFGQNTPFGSQLAPQTWVGQPGMYSGGQPFAQGNPLSSQFAQLSQMGQRPFQTQGISPWGY